MAKKQTLTLGINGYRLDTIIGVHHHERVQNQPLLISLHADVDVTVTQDKLESTVSYADFPDLIRAAAKNEPQLLETLATDILDATLASDHRILAAEIEIQKPQAVHGATCSFVKMRRSR